MPKMSVVDLRYPGSRMDADQIKSELEKIGFIFSGEIDEEGRQNFSLAAGWKIEGDFSSGSTYYTILDELGRHRLSVRRKIPWGCYDFISFVMVEPPVTFMSIQPSMIASICHGWE